MVEDRSRNRITYMLGEAVTKFHGVAFGTYLPVQSVGVKVSN